MEHDTKELPQIFNSTYFDYRISGLPEQCYTQEIGRRLTFVLENSIALEIYTTKRARVGQFFKIQALLCVQKPLCRCILVQISRMGKVKANIQYERLPTFMLFLWADGTYFFSP